MCSCGGKKHPTARTKSTSPGLKRIQRYQKGGMNVIYRHIRHIPRITIMYKYMYVYIYIICIIIYIVICIIISMTWMKPIFLSQPQKIQRDESQCQWSHRLSINSGSDESRRIWVSLSFSCNFGIEKNICWATCNFYRWVSCQILWFDLWLSCNFGMFFPW